MTEQILRNVCIPDYKKKKKHGRISAGRTSESFTDKTNGGHFLEIYSNH